MNCLDLIPYIAEQLEIGLPGEKFQLEMAPESRTIKELFEKNSVVKKSAVMILLFEKNGVLETIFIKRTENGGNHSGQIAFPGGKFEKTDNTLIKTALRETEEEIGIAEHNIMILGVLTDLFIPVSGFLVRPVVGFLKQKSGYKLNTNEVERIIEIKTEDLLNPDIKKIKTIQIKNFKIKAPYFKTREADIWGATAMILNEFNEIYQRALKKHYNYSKIQFDNE